MKLQELLKIDTSKSNWQKLLAKKGITPKVLSSIGTGGGGGSGFKYESSKVIWQVDPHKSTELANILSVLCVFPIYATYYKYADGAFIRFCKYYGISSSYLFGATIVQIELNSEDVNLTYIEECKGPYTVKADGEYFTYNRLIDFFIMAFQMPEQEVLAYLESIGLKQIPYDEVLSDITDRVDGELGNFLE